MLSDMGRARLCLGEKVSAFGTLWDVLRLSTQRSCPVQRTLSRTFLTTDAMKCMQIELLLPIEQRRQNYMFTETMKYPENASLIYQTAGEMAK